MEIVEATGTGQPDLHERLKAIRMSESERRLAITALQNAGLACDLVARAAGWLGALSAALMDPIRRRLAQP